MAGPYYVDNANGNDGNTGLSEVQAFATLEKAADTVAAGEIVYVQNGTDYTVQDGANGANLQISTIGTEASPISWIGYTTTITDNGVVTIDAGSSWSSAVNSATTDDLSYHFFKNFRFTGGTGEGVSSNASDSVVFENCRFDNNSSSGIHIDNNIVFINCEFDNNSQGINMDTGILLIACKFHDNSGYSVVAHHGVAFACEIYNETSGGIQFIAVTQTTAVINCTMDGDDNTGIGVYINDAGGITQPFAIINNIFHDLATGIESSTNDYKTAQPQSDMVIVKNNLFNSNTADSTRIKTGEDAIIDSAPSFTNEAGRDYTLASNSPAIDAGYDAGSIT